MVCLESIKLRYEAPDALAWNHDSSGLFTVRSFWRCLEDNNVRNNECPMCEAVKVKSSPVVSLPPISEFYFNVDGSAMGCLGEVGIRGVLRDVRAWIKCSDFGNLRLVHLIYDIRQFLKNMPSVDIKYMPKELNSFTDSLTKAASSVSRNRLE
ncbi:hypothetical protein Ddye_029465 [Dipteronia dyeriana]|uniref:Uncharacterized protein n=1 Tax=Dipteronia dyeriana TaxID=168575 RepID=A0AAD9TFL1_9ROSI|nr:hypothetical protein Ddye_029465 [Dipteronia dyeriana]